MATVPVENTALVEVRQELFGQLIENTLYFVLEGGWSPALLLALAEAVSTWFVTEVMANLSENLTLREVVARDLSAGATAQQVYAGDSGTPGASGTDSMPGGTSFVLSLRTALAGRSFRGRNYVAGVPTTIVSGNQVNALWASALVAAYNALASYVTVVDPDVVQVVVSRFEDSVARMTGLTTPVVVATFTDLFVDSQRKRLTGRGN